MFCFKKRVAGCDSGQYTANSLVDYRSVQHQGLVWLADYLALTLV